MNRLNGRPLIGQGDTQPSKVANAFHASVLVAYRTFNCRILQGVITTELEAPGSTLSHKDTRQTVDLSTSSSSSMASSFPRASDCYKDTEPMATLAVFVGSTQQLCVHLLAVQLQVAPTGARGELRCFLPWLGELLVGIYK